MTRQARGRVESEGELQSVSHTGQRLMHHYKDYLYNIYIIIIRTEDSWSATSFSADIEDSTSLITVDI